MTKKLARIRDISLGFEGHGILTCGIELKYNDSLVQDFGGYSLEEDAASRWIRGILEATGVTEWKDVPGHYVYAILDDKGRFNSRVIGIEPLPMNKGKPFYAKESKEESE